MGPAGRRGMVSSGMGQGRTFEWLGCSRGCGLRVAGCWLLIADPSDRNARAREKHPRCSAFIRAMSQLILAQHLTFNVDVSGLRVDEDETARRCAQQILATR